MTGDSLVGGVSEGTNPTGLVKMLLNDGAVHENNRDRSRRNDEDMWTEKASTMTNA
jgi:hypothetical protein